MKASRRCGLGWVVAVAVVGVMAVGAGSAEAGTICVSTAGSDANDGLSWGTAKLTVQAGLNAAVAGDEVWVAAGTYVGCITLNTGVALYGGFVGDETDFSQRNWTLNKSVLDGNKAGSVVTAPAGATASTRIEGFTIRNGTGTLLSIIPGSNGWCGGGISCVSSSPTIASNTIVGNNMGSGSYGAGIYISGGSPAITNNMIIGNIGGFGVGVCCSASAAPVIANNIIAGNSSSSFGGGVYCTSSSPTIVNNTITGNGAGSGGGVYCDSGSPVITNSIVAFNSSGIYKRGGTSGTPLLRYNCTYGNAVYNYSGLPDPTGTNGNINSDPRLASLAYAKLHVQPGSPCVDAGDDSAVQAGWLDVDGQSRKLGAHVDIGADESDGTEWPSGSSLVIRVRRSGDDACDGSSWSLAKRTVQAGTDAVAATGGQVWVAAGTYVENITVLPEVAVYGGFAGTETDLSQRDHRANVTVLDGNQAGSVVTVPPGADGTTRIDGFVIRNGSGTKQSSGYYFGGGICCLFSSPIIVNNTIAGNCSTQTLFGGGIYCAFSSATITNNMIVENGARYGAGIYCSSATPTIIDNTISSNGAQAGGGIYCLSSSPTVANNTIAGNGGISGGGVYCDSSSPAITNTLIAFNSSGIYNTGTGTPSLRYNCVYGNPAYRFSGLADPTGTNGNIAADPKLAGVAYGNTHIEPDSPCVDAGDDSMVQSGWTDMDGQARKLGAHVDIGADESDQTVWPGGPYVIVRVGPGGNDANDGSTWALAKQTVQAAIDAAAASGGEVWVAAGTYVGQVNLRNFAYLYGGFAGTETDRDARDWSRNVTILDGDGATQIVRAYQLGFQAGLIDGFTIRNGGFGIYCSMSSLVIANNTNPGGQIRCYYSSSTIANNTVTGSSGAGIYCDTGSPTITGNTTTGNALGGIFYGFCSGTIANNTITGNSGYGGIYCIYSSPTITNNTITGNTAELNGGGGICCVSSSGLTITDNTIAGNSALRPGSNAAGGGIYCDGSFTGTIAGNTITGNSAWFGGGIDCESSVSPLIANNTITGNVASYWGGGIACQASSSPTIVNNTITGNRTTRTTSYGGGISCAGGSPKIANNTILGNTAPANGGAIYCTYSSAIVTNTIIAFNSSGVYKTGSTAPTLRYNCVYANTACNFSGLTDPTGTNGNISADPLFASASPGTDGIWGTTDDAFGDLHLLPWSPCIDAGDNADVPADSADLDGDGNTTELLPFDLGGGLRFLDDPQVVDTGAGTPPIVDMGAFERGRPVGDVDGDWLTDVVDLLWLVDAFGTNSGDANYDPRCDFNGDGAVDVVDLLMLVEGFGK